MGYLLKEVLKTLCGVNQWSYAVFWKIGCQNPKILIWEDYYHEPASYSGPREFAGNETLENTFHKYNAQVNDRVHLLVNKLMTNNHVMVVGEGLVGRVAFTGNHQWILSETFYSQTHPPEVQKEVCQQFSDGMQTVAVVPVLPHGVVQFGSFLKIMENVGFVNQVTSLIIHLGYVSGIFQSEDYAAKGPSPRIGALSLESSFAVTPCSFDDLSCIGRTSVHQCQTSFPLASGVQNELQLDGASFQSSSSTSSRRPNYDQDVEIAGEVKVDCSPSNHKFRILVKADVIPTNSELWKKQHTGCDVSGSTLDIPSSSAFILNHGNVRFREQEMLPETSNHGPFSIPNFSSSFMPTTKANSGLLYCSSDSYVTRLPVEVNGLFDGCPSNRKPISGLTSTSDEKLNVDEQNIFNGTTSAEIKSAIFRGMEASNSDPFDQFKATTFLAHGIGNKHQYIDHKLVLSELKACKGGIARTTLSQNGDHLKVNNNTTFEGNISPGINKHDDAYDQPESGDDLFDVLGADFKNKLISGCWNSSTSNESTANMQGFDNSLPAKQIVDSGMLQSIETDHLLDAMVSKVQISAKSIMDCGTSCQSTSTNVSSSSAPDTSLPYSRLIVVSENPKDELFGVPKYVTKAEAASSCLLRTGTSEEESRTFSQCSSIYGSQFSSWVEDGKDGKKSESVSTGYYKKPDETSKTTRKRLRPGENPRPRPKDRQMIQDRVKELREIVPNAAKCSIDALLETIKHMLFLQSVMKHADKLKQTGESKIISKDGGLLLKDNLAGGATWAYEVGSQSMVCPIIVEDLNQPRQMLVEMLCEERGLFLEIADVIRGLGLTILKGIMEARNNKIWARFAVEANRDITRMEIFISLVHLVEQGATSGVAQPNGISNKNIIAKQLQPIASVPQCGKSYKSPVNPPGEFF